MLLRGVGTLRYLLILIETLLVKCPSLQWLPDGLKMCTKKCFPGAGFLGAPPIPPNLETGRSGVRPRRGSVPCWRTLRRLSIRRPETSREICGMRSAAPCQATPWRTFPNPESLSKTCSKSVSCSRSSVAKDGLIRCQRSEVRIPDSAAPCNQGPPASRAHDAGQLLPDTRHKHKTHSRGTTCLALLV